MRPLIERRRLMRIFERMAREPTSGEHERLRALIKVCNPGVRAGDLFIGMHAVTLTHDNKEQLDVEGFASLKADGLHCHLARVNLSTPQQSQPNGTESTEAPPAGPERLDTALFITRDHRVLAVDRVLIHNDNKRLLLDGELCLRKIHLSEDERLRINSAHNVHVSNYLDYYANADEAAALAGIDIASDEHQAQYDDYYELVYAAFDCLLITTRQMNRDYLQRITLVHEMTETMMTQTATAALRRRMAQIKRAVDYAGGPDQTQLTVFLKPTWSVKDIRAAMHAVPSCMQGIATDGVIFNPNRCAYVVGTNARLLKFKPHHTADLAFVRDSKDNALSICVTAEGGALTKVLTQILTDTPSARRLSEMRGSPLIFECEAVMRDAGSTVADIWWRPLQHRSEKKAPNSYETYQSVVRAVLRPLDEEAVVDYVRQRLAQSAL